MCFFRNVFFLTSIKITVFFDISKTYQKYNDVDSSKNLQYLKNVSEVLCVTCDIYRGC